MRSALWLFLTFTALYALTSGGHFYASDEVQKLAVLDAIARHGTFAIDQGWVTGANGHTYAWFPLGASLVMLPGWLVGQLAACLAPGLPAVYITRFCVAMENAFFSAALVTLCYVWARRMGAARGGAPLLGVALGAGSVIWPYAKTAWSEPVTALCVYAGLFALWHALDRPAARQAGLMAAGLAFAIAASIRQEFALPALGAALWWASMHRDDPRGIPRELGYLLLPLVAVALFDLAYDAVRFGNAFSFPSYTEPQQHIKMPEGRLAWSLRNLYGYTLSPNQGLPWYSPVVLAGLAGWPRFLRTRPEAARLLAAALGPLLAFYVLGWGVSTWAWGLRYSYVFVPALVLPVAWIWRGPARWAAIACILVSITVQIAAVVPNFQDLYEHELARHPGLTIRELVTQPEHAPLWLALRDDPTLLQRGYEVLSGEAVPAGTLRERRAELPDMWWVLVLLEPVKRRVVLLVVLGLCLACALFARSWVAALYAEVPAAR